MEGIVTQGEKSDGGLWSLILYDLPELAGHESHPKGVPLDCSPVSLIKCVIPIGISSTI